MSSTRSAALIVHSPADSKTADEAVEAFRARARKSIAGWRFTLLAVDALSRGEAACALKQDVVIVAGVHHLRRPDIVEAALRKIEEGALLVVGSRNAAGGSWAAGPAGRVRLRPRLESFLVRVILFFPTRHWFKVGDPTSGFFAFKPGINPGGGGTGGKAGLPTPLPALHALVRACAKVDEIAVRAGDARGDAGHRARAIRTAVGLRWRSHETKRFLKFCAVGFAGYVVNASALELFRNSRISAAVSGFFASLPAPGRFPLVASQSAWSAAMAAELAIVGNFLLNNFWTFAGNGGRSPFEFAGRLMKFNLTSFGGIVIQFFVIGLATRVFGDTPPVRGAALVFAIAFLIIPYNWTMYNRVIWKGKRRG
jgi:putative flippase GtrA